MLACVDASPIPGYVAVASLGLLVIGLIAVIISFLPRIASRQLRKYAGVMVGVGILLGLVSSLFLTMRCGGKV